MIMMHEVEGELKELGMMVGSLENPHARGTWILVSDSFGSDDEVVLEREKTEMAANHLEEPETDPEEEAEAENYLEDDDSSSSWWDWDDDPWWSIGYADGVAIIPGEPTPWDEERQPLENALAAPLPYEWAENGEANLPRTIGIRRDLLCFRKGIDGWDCRKRSDTRNRSKKQCEVPRRRCKKAAEANRNNGNSNGHSEDPVSSIEEMLAYEF